LGWTYLSGLISHPLKKRKIYFLLKWLKFENRNIILWSFGTEDGGGAAASSSVAMEPYVDGSSRNLYMQSGLPQPHKAGRSAFVYGIPKNLATRLVYCMSRSACCAKVEEIWFTAWSGKRQGGGCGLKSNYSGVQARNNAVNER
jgi:hypothetical protein